MLPGPQSKPITGVVASSRGGIAARLEMPPRFSATIATPGRASSQRSTIGTSGAPQPPAAMSFCRKSLTTGQPSRTASTAASPICSVATPCSCATVWPWLPTSSTLTPSSAARPATAAAKASPVSAVEPRQLQRIGRMSPQQPGREALVPRHRPRADQLLQARLAGRHAADRDVDAIHRGAAHQAGDDPRRCGAHGLDVAPGHAGAAPLTACRERRRRRSAGSAR